MTRRRVAVGIGALVVIGVGIAVVPRVAAQDEPADESVSEATAPSAAELTTVERRDLTESQSANGSIGFGETRSLQAQAEGVVTEAPEVGDVLRPGDVAARVAQRPVVLVEGETPMYRELRRVRSGERDDAGDKLGEQFGDDVKQLQEYLIGVGLDNDGDLTADGIFGKETERAVKEWQRFVGHPATGQVDRSQMVFIGGPVRVESAPAIGAPFEDLTVTDVDAVATVSVTSKQRSFFTIGSEVEVELASSTITGTVSDVERVVGDDGSAQFRVEVELPADIASGEVEAGDSAKVTASKTIAENALTVPVRALIALAEGGWAVQVNGPTGPVLTGVELGAVVDGFAEIDGVEADTTIVVPA